MEEIEKTGDELANREAQLKSAFDDAFAALKEGRSVPIPDRIEGVPQVTQAKQEAQPTEITQTQQVPQPPQPVQPPQETQETQVPTFSTKPTTAEQLRGLFSAKVVQPADADSAESPPDDPIPEPENMDDKARNAWAESRAREKQFRQLFAQQKQQIDAFSAKQEEFRKEREQLAAALKAKDDELKAANDKLGKLDLSGSIEFRKRYDEPLRQAEANLDAAITDIIAGTDTPEQVAQARAAIMSDDTTFQNYVSGLSVDEQATLIQKRRTLMELSAQRQKAIDDWQLTARGLTEAAASRNAADAALARRRNAEAAMRFSKQDVPVESRAYVLTDPAFADDVRIADEAFEGFMQTATDEEMARAAYLGHFIPSMNRALMQALDIARQYQDAYYAATGVRPRTRTTEPQVQEPPKVPEKPKTREELEEMSQRRIEDTLAALSGRTV